MLKIFFVNLFHFFKVIIYFNLFFIVFISLISLDLSNLFTLVYFYGKLLDLFLLTIIWFKFIDEYQKFCFKLIHGFKNQDFFDIVSIPNQNVNLIYNSELIEGKDMPTIEEFNCAVIAAKLGDLSLFNELQRKYKIEFKVDSPKSKRNSTLYDFLVFSLISILIYGYFNDWVYSNLWIF